MFFQKIQRSLQSIGKFCCHYDLFGRRQKLPVHSRRFLRLPIPYVDPKAADGTTEEAAVYDERTKQIATEMFYLMSQVES